MIGGYELCLIIIIIAIATIFLCNIRKSKKGLSYDDYQSYVNHKKVIFFIIIGIIILIGYIVPKSMSYCLAMRAEAYLQELKQDVVGLQLYITNANRPSGAKGGQLVSDLTDTKYKDYQRYLKIYIDRIILSAEAYNSYLITKRRWKKSFMWKGLIVLPLSELKVIQIEDLIMNNSITFQ